MVELASLWEEADEELLPFEEEAAFELKEENSPNEKEQDASKREEMVSGMNRWNLAFIINLLRGPLLRYNKTKAIPFLSCYYDTLFALKILLEFRNKKAKAWWLSPFILP